MDELIEKLRSVKWEEADDGDRTPDDPTHKCVFVDMRPDDFRALLREAAAALEAAREDAERYRWLRKGANRGANDDVAVVRGLGSMDYGMSAVVYTYSEEIDGDDLDAAIDQARGKGLVPEPPEVG